MRLKEAATALAIATGSAALAGDLHPLVVALEEGDPGTLERAVIDALKEGEGFWMQEELDPMGLAKAAIDFGEERVERVASMLLVPGANFAFKPPGPGEDTLEQRLRLKGRFFEEEEYLIGLTETVGTGAEISLMLVLSAWPGGPDERLVPWFERLAEGGNPEAAAGGPIGLAKIQSPSYDTQLMFANAIEAEAESSILYVRAVRHLAFLRRPGAELADFLETAMLRYAASAETDALAREPLKVLAKVRARLNSAQDALLQEIVEARPSLAQEASRLRNSSR